MLLIVVTVVVLVVIYDTRQTVSTTIQPYLQNGTRDVATVLDNAATMSSHASSIAGNSDTLMTTSLPKLIDMLNQTQALMNRFESFSAHPSINIGVGGATLSGGG